MTATNPATATSTVTTNIFELRLELVLRGHTLDKLELKGSDELSYMIERDSIPGEDGPTCPMLISSERVVACVRALKPKHGYKLAELYGTDGSRIIRSVQSMDWEDVCAEFPGLVLFTAEKLVEKKLRRLSMRQDRLAARSKNRALYIHTPVLKLRPIRGDSERYRLQFETNVQPAGLLDRYYERVTGRAASEPLVLSMVNELPRQKDGTRPDYPRSELDHMMSLGWMCVGRKALFNMLPEVRDYILKAVPLAIDGAGYLSRFRSPLVPNGYLPQVQVRCEQLQSITSRWYQLQVGLKYLVSLNEAGEVVQAQLPVAESATMRLLNAIRSGNEVARQLAQERQLILGQVVRAEGWELDLEVVESYCDIEGPDGNGETTLIETQWETRPMGVDGAGYYNPDHPVWESMMEEYGKDGAPPVQITLMDADGFLAKGMLFPREGLDVAVVVDHDQVKGSWKGFHKQAKADGMAISRACDIGVIRVFNRPATIGSCFEMLENVLDNGRTRELIEELVEEQMSRVAKGGIDGIVAMASREDDNLKLIHQMLTRLKEHYPELNPMSFPLVANKVHDKLGRVLWDISQGAGIRGQQLVTLMDSSVPEGRVVVAGVRPGKQVALWRFPMVLGQGLVTADVIEPRPHHLVKGKVPANMIIMNPRDLVDRMQGDDDGDVIGLSTDPRVLELFEHVIDKDVWLIEPEGTKLDWKITDPEGLEYLMSDPMGPVGLMTYFRSALLAADDIDGARAMSVMIQEAIDSEKKRVRYTDWRKAANPDNWVEIGDRRVLHVEGVTDNYLDPSEYEGNGFPQEQISNWWNQRLVRFGVERKKVDGQWVGQMPLGWKSQHERKKINLAGWRNAWMAQDGCEMANLVHHTHDATLSRWRIIEDNFQATECRFELREVLIQLLVEEGVEFEVLDLSFSEYRNGLKRKSGLDQYGKEMRNILVSDQGNEGESDFETRQEERWAAIDRALGNLHERLRKLTVSELATVWYQELTPREDFDGRPLTKANRALRAVSFPGSQIMKRLGFELHTCEYLDDKLKQVVDWALKMPNPHHAMSQVLYQSSRHGDWTEAQGLERVDAWDCPDCRRRLPDELIRRLRAESGAEALKPVTRILRELTRLRNAEG